MDSTEKSEPASQGAGSLCTRCKNEPHHKSSDWGKECLAVWHAMYRERRRKPEIKEERECAWRECSNVFVWSSWRSRQTCCSKPCSAKHRYWGDRPRPEVGPLKIIHCSRCDQDLPRDQFSPSRQGQKTGWCRACSRAYHKEWAARNPAQRSAATRKTRTRTLLRKYGAPSDDIEVLLDWQGWVCGICGKDLHNTRVPIDHDHAKPENESYRGLLCGNCNMGLGAFGEDVDRLQLAIEYLASNL